MFRWGSITEGMLRQLLSSTRLRIINLQLVNSLTDELFKVENTIIAWCTTKTVLLCLCAFMFDRQDILDRNPLPSLEFLTLEQCHGSWLSFVQILNEPVQVIVNFFKQQQISKTKFNWFFQAECQSPWATPLPKWTSCLPPCVGLRKVLRYLSNIFSLHIIFFEINI